MTPFQSSAAALVLIDLQERLLAAMPDADGLLKRVDALVRGAQALHLPICVTEQVPEKLGPTHPAISGLLGSCSPIPKSAFSCAREPAFQNWMAQSGRTQWILAGIESHVCVFQTARDLFRSAHPVCVVADAVMSRHPSDRDLALAMLRASGVAVYSSEMILFDLLEDARAPAFRSVSRVVR